MTDPGSELLEEVLANKTTELTINAEPLDYAPWVYFWMTATYSKFGGKKQGEYLKFDKHAGKFDLTFTLSDRSGLNLSFYENFEDAIWAEVGTRCPPARGDGGGVILPRLDPKEPVQAGYPPPILELKAINLNEKAQLLTFMLRFSGDGKDGTRVPYEFDPKIINGGG